MLTWTEERDLKSARARASRGWLLVKIFQFHHRRSYFDWPVNLLSTAKPTERLRDAAGDPTIYHRDPYRCQCQIVESFVKHQTFDQNFFLNIGSLRETDSSAAAAYWRIGWRQWVEASTGAMARGCAA